MNTARGFADALTADCITISFYLSFIIIVTAKLGHLADAAIENLIRRARARTLLSV
jgi:hypothetical protein